MTILYEKICINRQTKHGHLISKISISKDNTTAKIQHELDGKPFDFLFGDLPTSIHFILSSGSGILQQLSTLNIAKQLRKQYVAYIGCVGLYNEPIILDVSDNATSENCDIILISEDELKLFNQNHIEAIKKAIEYEESVIENTNLSMVFVENGNVMKAQMNDWKMKRLSSLCGYTIPEPSFSHPSVTIKSIWHVHYYDELDKNEFCYYDLHHCNISDELIAELNVFHEEIEKIRLACYHINELKRKLDEAYQFSKKINEISNSNTKQSPLVQLSYQELKQKEKEYDLAFNEGGDGFNPYRAYLEEKFNEPIPMSKDLETKPDC